MVAARGSQLRAEVHAAQAPQDMPVSSVPRITSGTTLATLTYQSRAVQPLSEAELHQLLQSAQARNKAANITGLLIYDNGRFFQCLEGPAQSVEMVWNAIRQDTRHTDVELLGNSPTSKRFFANWDMRLAQSLTPANSLYRMQTAIRRLDLSEALPATQVANAHSALSPPSPVSPTCSTRRQMQRCCGKRVGTPELNFQQPMRRCKRWLRTLGLTRLIYR